MAPHNPQWVCILQPSIGLKIKISCHNLQVKKQPGHIQNIRKKRYIFFPPMAPHNPQWVCILQPSIGL